MSELETNNTPGAVENTETETKTYTQAEVDELLQKETDRRVTSALKKQEAKNSEKLREAQKVAAMSAEEKYRYELDQREADLAARERELLMAENKNECSKILAEKGMSLDLVKFVVADSAEEMNENIKSLERAFKASVKAEVEKRLGSTAPKKNIGGNEGLTREQFNKLSLAELQRLSVESPEVYKQFTNI